MQCFSAKCDSPNVLAIWVGSYHTSPNFWTLPYIVIFFVPALVDICKVFLLALILVKRSGFMNVTLILEPESRRITSSRFQLGLGFPVSCAVQFSPGCNWCVIIHSIQRYDLHVYSFDLHCRTFLWFFCLYLVEERFSLWVSETPSFSFSW